MSQINSAAPELATQQDAAARYKTSVTTIRRMIARGDIAAYRLPGSRLIRVDLNEIDRAMVPIPTAATGVGPGRQ